MIVVGEWLASRDPAPPPELAARLAEIVGPSVCADGELPDALADLAQQLLAGLCEERQGALDLLAADALITYALEAAAEDCHGVEEAAGRVLGTISTALGRGGQT